MRTSLTRSGSARSSPTAAATQPKATSNEPSASFRAALNLWRGPALDGLGSAALSGPAARLDEQRLGALELCARWRLPEHHRRRHRHRTHRRGHRP
ncbi:BTAD domain-containing putative transcriptional regulator [Streptomyces sp. NPDC089173]|uniref:BTAD domain-containing putative transcriptional regulator n=1 Tax=Streptomyces sp. NPDC089173 TaxID=3154965 RepID=UPI00344FE4C1